MTLFNLVEDRPFNVEIIFNNTDVYKKIYLHGKTFKLTVLNFISFIVLRLISRNLIRFK